METQCRNPLAGHKGAGTGTSAGRVALACGKCSASAWRRMSAFRLRPRAFRPPPSGCARIITLATQRLDWRLGAMGLGVALSELPWGVATDRWGDRPILLTGLATTAAALLAMMLFVVPSACVRSGLVWLVLAMCVVGLLGGSVNGSSGRAVMRWFQEGERGLAMSIRQTAVPLGGGLGALILPWLASTGGFRSVYGVLAVMCAVSGVLGWRWLHEPPDAPEAPASAHAGSRVPAAPAVSPLRDRMIWRVVVGIGILCIPQFAVLTFATVFLHDFGQSA